MFNLLRGLGIPPVVVGFVRGAIETAVVAALGAIALYISDSEYGAEAWAALIILVVRTVEGLADQIDPSK